MGAKGLALRNFKDCLIEISWVEFSFRVCLTTLSIWELVGTICGVFILSTCIQAITSDVELQHPLVY